MLRDDMIRTRRDWDTAVAYVIDVNILCGCHHCLLTYFPSSAHSFMQSRLETEFLASTQQLQEMQGPGGWYSWITWKRYVPHCAVGNNNRSFVPSSHATFSFHRPTSLQRTNRAVASELSSYFKANEPMRSGLNTEEVSVRDGRDSRQMLISTSLHRRLSLHISRFALCSIASRGSTALPLSPRQSPTHTL